MLGEFQKKDIKNDRLLMDSVKMDFIQLETLCQVILKFIRIADKKKEKRIFEYKSRLFRK